ncbi:MAG: hypothetical protein ACW99Q_25020 [Candidatus Kariarchaeaceae archaeon]|jgi:hypothetical protein
MKKEIIWILLIGFFIMAIDVQDTYCQEDEPNSGKIGVGISFFNLVDFLLFIDEIAYTNSIYFPINISDRFRIEPEIGVLSSGSDVLYSLGLGVFGLSGTNDISWYYGMRIGTWNAHFIKIAPTLGGEYYLSRRFSLGAEAQILGLIENDDFMFMTNTIAFVRLYFL